VTLSTAAFAPCPVVKDPEETIFAPRRNRFRLAAKAAGNGRRRSMVAWSNDEVRSCWRLSTCSTASIAEPGWRRCDDTSWSVNAETDLSFREH
jgi:hypothetical protein